MRATWAVVGVLLASASAQRGADGGPADGAPAPRPAATYSNEVVRILQRRCQQCHRPGQIGPFSLLTYDDAAAWGETIREVVESRRMPPWHADRSVGKFSNDRTLSDDEIFTLLSWIDAGMPRGADSDLPPPARFAEGWQIGQPDLVLSMPEDFRVPASGTIPYKYINIPWTADEDQWIQGVELQAGNRSVVHHILMLVHPPGAERAGRPRDRARGTDEQAFGFFAALAPGNPAAVFPPGFGKRIPKGSEIVFQMHYTANGTPQTDRSRVGLVFAREPVHTEIHTRGVFNTFFSIPPGAADHEVRAAYRFPKDSVVLSLMPHMHLRGKSFEYVAEFPDGSTRPLLRVPRFDFGWQLSYELAEPLAMPTGSKILCTAHYDNSPANKANPDPTKAVGWGDQTWDEMMIGYINYYVKRPGGGEQAAGE